MDGLDQVADALERVEGIIQKVLALARSDKVVSDPAPVAFGTVAEAARVNSPLDAGQLEIEDVGVIECDEERLQTLLENLFRNSVDHGGPDVAVTVGPLEDGFYVADDGPGIPPDEREHVFDVGYSTSDVGTGLGLDIVAEIVAAHGWDVAVSESERHRNDGRAGARFEFTGVESDPG